ncbi:hypothetical protein IB232_06645 [Pseudomonas sp. PDM15]|uniref:hypothetical protein n=1 Tax=Pseudomonas sp. PDM15 TaxID=2769303 RepID=UPI00177D033A|nr:hypothetical protein [Pseudomonas sp. PDM15]MBD9424991.1 hypothetical protein [Pseudomonas sp. PDM15]
MKTFDLYATKVTSIDEIKSRLEAILSVKFFLHDSSFWGAYYRSDNEYAESIRILPNFNGKELLFEELEEWPVIVEVNSPEDPSQIISHTETSLEHIHRTEVQTGEWAKKYLYVDGKLTLILERSLI